MSRREEHIKKEFFATINEPKYSSCTIEGTNCFITTSFLRFHMGLFLSFAELPKNSKYDFYLTKGTRNRRWILCKFEFNDFNLDE